MSHASQVQSSEGAESADVVTRFADPLSSEGAESADVVTRFAEPLSSQGGESADVVTRFADRLRSEGAESADVMLIWMLILGRNMRQCAPERPSEVHKHEIAST